jgi:tetratricopeptide (TPR) repeat protein
MELKGIQLSITSIRRTLLRFSILILITHWLIGQTQTDFHSFSDTTQIKILFEKGDRFIDGPSDSLIFYYQIALEKIQQFALNSGSDPKKFTRETIETFKKLNFRALNELGIEHFFKGLYHDALDYHLKALEIAEETGDPGMISECYGSIGIVLKNQGRFPEALSYYEKALDMAFTLRDTSWIAACYSNIANVYRRLGNYEKALRYHLQAKEIFEKSGENRRIAISLMNIGSIFQDQNDLNQALEYYSRALSLSHETNDHKRIAESLINIGNIYLDRKDIKESRIFFLKALEIHIEHGFRHTLASCYNLIGNTYEVEGDYKKAVDYYEKSFAFSEQEGDEASMTEVLGNISRINMNQGNYQKALSSARLSHELAEKNSDILSLRNAYRLLSDAAEGLGDRKSALNYLKEFIVYNDSLFNIEKYRSLREIEAKFELEKKEQEVVLLSEKTRVQQLVISQRSRMIYLILLLLLLILVIGLILYRNHRLKTHHQAIELQQRLLRSQMNPHFIFNSLVAIQSFIYSKEPQVAGDYLAKFSDLVRMTLDSSREEFVYLEKELKLLKIFLELQSLRFDHQFEYELHVDKELNTENTLAPPMLAQPFVENAIEHGLRHRKTKGNLFISLRNIENKIVCSIEDDGIGREASRELEKKRQHQSMATSITRERLEVMGKQLGKKFSLEIIDLKSEKGEATGTRVVFEMPCKSC